MSKNDSKSLNFISTCLIKMHSYVALVQQYVKNRNLIPLIFPLLYCLFTPTSNLLAQSYPGSFKTGNWSSADTWQSSSLTGTATSLTTSKNITGSGTSFSTEFNVGDAFYLNKVYIGMVASIESNTSLTLVANAASGQSARSVSRGRVPISTDAITINGGHTVTVDVTNAVCGSLAVGPTGAGTSRLTFSSTGSPKLLVANGVTIGNSGNDNRIGIVTFTNGSMLECGNLNLGAVSPNVNSLVMTNGGYLKVNGSMSVFSGFTWTPGTGTVEFTASNTLPNTIITSFNKLVISSGTTTLATNINSTATTGSLEVKKGAVLATSTFSFGGTTSIPSIILETGSTGSSITGTGTLNIGGSITVNSGSGSSGASISAPITLKASTTSTVANDPSVENDLTISGVISGAFSFAKSGPGKMILSGSNTYTGSTTINEGTLALGADNVIHSSSNLVLNGGTFSTDGYSETMGTLSVTDNSTIALGSKAHNLTFSNSAAVAWTAGKTLTITGWTGEPGSSGTIGDIFIGTSASDLSSSNLSQVLFDGYGRVPAGQLSNGEMVPRSSLVFRSLTSGAWNSKSSWQQQYDGVNWVDAAVFPSSKTETISSSTAEGYPVILGTSTQALSDRKSHIVNFPTPANSANGDLIVILWADHSDPAENVLPVATGWTKVPLGTFHGDKHNAILFYKVIGSSDGSSAEFTTNASDASTQIVYRIQQGTFDASAISNTSIYLTNKANFIQSPSHTVAQSGKYTWITAGFSHALDVNTIITPTNYSNLIAPSAIENAQVFAASRNSDQLTETPASFQVKSSETWVAATIAIKGSGSTTTSSRKTITTILSGHTITINNNATADTVNVLSGGTLTFSNANNRTLDISSGSPMTVSGTIEIPEGSYISGDGSFSLASGGTFKVGSHEGLTTSGATGNVRVTGTRSFHSLANYYYNHNGNQNTGNAVTAAANIYIQGGGIKTLSSPITVSQSLVLTDGYPYTTSTNLFTIANYATVSGGSDDTYVIGPLRKVGTNNVADYSFIYPVGFPVTFNNTEKTKTNNTFNPVKIKYPGVVSNDITFTVTHFHGDPLSQVTPNLDATVQSMKNRVIQPEYWDVHNDVPGTSGAVSNVLGTYGVDVTLYFDNKNSSRASTAYYLLHAKTENSSTFWEAPNLSTQTFDKADLSFGKKMLYVTVIGQKSFSGMGATGTDGTTPVTLTNFNARLTPENTVALSWATASESVNKGFRIERQHESEVGKFHNIGFVPSKAEGGNSAQLLRYNFTDIAPKVGTTSYYRLVQEDIDGKLTNSEVRMIRLDGQSVSLVYPNPSKGDFLISRTADGKKMNIQVVDLSGKTIKQINGIESATHKLFIQQPGIYNIKLTYPETGEQSIQRVIVQ